MKALLMVGGEGRRLRPLTADTPKSLLRVGRHTILDHTLTLLRRAGIADVTLAVNYLAEKIEHHVASGNHQGLTTSFLREQAPLGTAGALSLLEGFDDTVLMMNGDIITDIDIIAMLQRHRSHGAALSVASKVMYTDLSLGVLDVNEHGLIEAYREKPRPAHRFSIGIYLVEPRVRAYLHAGERVDVPELIARLLAAGEIVYCYDHPGHWVDIGLPEDYARLQTMAEELAALTPVLD